MNKARILIQSTIIRKCQKIANPNYLVRTTMSLTDQERPVEFSIKKKLTQQLEPAHMEIINESYMHSVPKGSETHFKVVVVSKKFEGLPLIKRHRMVNHFLEDELKSGVHALSILAKTPDQWEAGEKVDKSPTCLGGFGK